MQYVYIHGFGTTGSGSYKFKLIKDFALKNHHQAFALEWNEFQDEITNKLINQLDELVDYSKPICLIGSSTGGNFTYQILDKIKSKAKSINFILINPLLNVEQRKIENLNFPLKLANQLQDPPLALSNGLVLLGKRDEVLDYNYSYQKLSGNNKVIVGDNWNHTLRNLPVDEFIKYISL